MTERIKRSLPIDALIARVDALEERIAILESKAHDTHTIDQSALEQISTFVKRGIIQTLQSHEEPLP